MKKLLKSKGWSKILYPEFKKEYFCDLTAFLENEMSNGTTIYPDQKDLFAAFNNTDFEDIKVVIIGQDPYHGENQAHGMSFSVREGVKVPPSLRNIYKELHSDIGFEIPNHGHLMKWAKQGVLLLNACLSVEAHKANSHRKKGWEIFTDKVIEEINNKREGVVFMLWGTPAHKKAKMVDDSKHCVLKSVHPSPLAAYRGFFGSKHFSKANEYLESVSKSPIDWQLDQ